MKFLRFYILYRLYFIISLIVLGVLLYIYVDKITAWLCFIASFISILLYFLVGTMRLVQDAAQEGDIDKAVDYLNKIKFPRLLLKPVRSAYYMLQSNFNLVNKDLDKAEENIRKGIKSKSSLAGDTEGMMLFQLAMISLQKGNMKEGRSQLLQAIKAGIPDNENLAAAYLQLSGIEIQRRQFSAGKNYFRKAKSLKPKTAQLVDQIKEMDKALARLPG